MTCAWHEGAGACDEDHALRVAQVHGAAAGDHDFLAGQNEPETGDGFQDFPDGQGRIAGKRRARNGIEDVDGHHIGANGLQLKRQGLAPVLARFAHADDATGTNLDASLFEMADGLQPIVEGGDRRGLREKPARAFQVMAVAFHAGLQAVGHALVLDDAQLDPGGVLPWLSFRSPGRRFRRASAPRSSLSTRPPSRRP